MPLPDFADLPNDEQLGDPGGFDHEPLADDHGAEKMMRRLVAAQTRVIEATLKYQAWVGEIDEWYAAETANDRRIMERLDLLLQAYGVYVRTETGDRVKTVRLPSGEIATTKATEPSVHIDDEKAVMVWAEDCLDGTTFDVVAPETRHVLVSELRKVVAIHERPVEDEDGETVEKVVLDRDGNVVPGVRIDVPETKAKVKPRG